MEEPSCESLLQRPVLIVDDEETARRQLLQLLVREGYCSVHSVPNLEQAEAALLEIKPQLVLLDWHVGAETGLEVMHAIERALPEALRPPVIILTGDSDPETKRVALEAGAADFLNKPLDPVDVKLRVRNHLRLASLRLQVLTENDRLDSMVQERTAELNAALHELREVQKQVIAEERMRAFATMAGGVVHDFNNALMIIHGYAELYGRADKPASAEEFRRAFQLVATASHDAAVIVRRLREFYSPISAIQDARQEVELNSLVQEALELTRPKWDTDCRARGICVELVTQYGELPTLAAAPAELREVLLNLVFNAVDAMPQGGLLSLRTERTGKFVKIVVSDTGTGMTEETRRRCLEPFYTTKGDRGTGLGLSSVYGIIRRHGGWVEIASELNKGSEFAIYLPVRHTSELPVSEDFSVVRNLRILMVDDDPKIGAVVKQFLEQDGHEVLLARSGSEALEQFQKHTFDVVVTDRVMPKMSGDQLARAIRELHPEMPIVELTGYESDRLCPDVNVTISKPATQAKLQHALSHAVFVDDHRASLDLDGIGASTLATVVVPLR